MKVRALIPVAGLIVLPLAACHGTGSTTDSPVLVSPSVTAPVVTTPKAPAPTPPPTHARKPVQKTTPEPTAHCMIRYQMSEPLPDPKCTPGAIQSSDTKAICTPGWATAHREYFSVKQREIAFAKYGIITTDPAAYGEYDHLIPLELGGSNNSDNLWPEPGKIPNAKDAVEDALHGAVCSGKLPLAKAQEEIAKDWVTVPDTFQTSSKTTVHAPATHSVVTHKATHSASPASKPAMASCYPTSSNGNCYKRGQFCPSKDSGMSGVAGNGMSIKCESSGSRYRWE